MHADRRTFLGFLAGAAAALATAPSRLLARMAAPLPAAAPQDYWAEVRRQFLIPADEAFFNTGTLGSPPRVVIDAVTSHMTHVARDIADWDYKAGHEQFFTGYAPELPVRTKLARLINADALDVGLTQNATMAMNFVANGLDLAAGDEIIVLEGAHPGGRCGWELRAKRHGARVVFVKPPQPAQSPEQLSALYEQATTARTRVWAIPHLTSGLGPLLFPVDELCRRARERGILSVVDGAQTLGHLRIDVQRMGCDVFFSSPHKWLLAPVGNGLLYIRRDAQPRFWTTLASSNWDNHDDGMFRLMQYGTGNLSLLVGLESAIDFHLQLGPQRVEARIMELATRLRTGLQQIDGVFLHTPAHPALLSGTTIWGITGMGGDVIQDALWERAQVRVRHVGDGVRQCCHIYNSEAEVDRSLAATHALASGARRGPEA